MLERGPKDEVDESDLRLRLPRGHAGDDITPTVLTRAAGVAAIAAGSIFIGVQIKHPNLNTTSITTTNVYVRDSLEVLMYALAVRDCLGAL